MRRSCTGFRNRLMPVTLASCGRRRAMTAWPPSLRWPLGFRLTNTKPPPAREPPVNPITVATAGVGPHDVHQLAQLDLHLVERDALVGAHAAVQLAGVLLREEALGHRDEQPHVERDDGTHSTSITVTLGIEGPVERAFVDVQRATRSALSVHAREAAAPRLCLLRHACLVAIEQPRAHHRRGGERDDQRDHHRHRQRHRELAEQAAGLAAHEQQRDEHGDQRQADRQHREADLLGAEQRGLQAAPCPARCGGWCSPSTTIASSTTKPVATVSAIRLRLSRLKFSRYITPKVPSSDTTVAMPGTSVARQAVQEHADDQHHQRHGDQQRDLDFVQRCADRVGGVGGDLQLDVGWAAAPSARAPARARR